MPEDKQTGETAAYETNFSRTENELQKSNKNCSSYFFIPNRHLANSRGRFMSINMSFANSGERCNVFRRGTLSTFLLRLSKGKWEKITAIAFWIWTDWLIRRKLSESWWNMRLTWLPISLKGFVRHKIVCTPGICFRNDFSWRILLIGGSNSFPLDCFYVIFLFLLN